MIRSFVAIEVPSEIRHKLAEICRALKGLGLIGSFVRPEAMHLTLQFLGNIEEDSVPGIERALQDACKGVRPFTLTVRGLGVFPHPGRPRVAWAGLDNCPALTTLHQRLGSALSREGFEPETRAFHPHLTLLRLKSQKNSPSLARFVREKEENLPPMPFPVSSVHLFQSILGPGGAKYHRLASTPLTGE